MTRHKPIRHTVRAHIRVGRSVNSYERGSGIRPQRSQRSRVVGVAPEYEQLKYPVTAEVLSSQVVGYEYDYDEEINRPVGFRMTILTDDDARGHEDEEWVEGALDLFPTLDNSIREGYTVDDVRVVRDTYNPRKYTIKIYLKSGVPDIETEQHEEAYMRRLAEETLPGR